MESNTMNTPSTLDFFNEGIDADTCSKADLMQLLVTWKTLGLDNYALLCKANYMREDNRWSLSMFDRQRHVTSTDGFVSGVSDNGHIYKLMKESDYLNADDDEHYVDIRCDGYRGY